MKVAIITTCRDCKGLGAIGTGKLLKWCNTCNGYGEVTVQRELTRKEQRNTNI